MRMLAVLFILGMHGIGMSGNANAYDKDGYFIILAPTSCSEFLDAYSRTTLNEEGYIGPNKSWRAFGYINGYLSAYNLYVDNGKENIKEGMTYNDVYRWVASWCRDNSSQRLDEALNAFVLK